jgi:hypothetical protein
MANIEFNRPDYPVELTRKSWDKKKSVLAKAAGRTGIGDAMDKAKAAYDAVDWKTLEALNHPPEARRFTLDGLAGTRDAALKEMIGGLAKFSQSLYAVRSLADLAAEKFQKDKTIPKSDVKTAQEIALMADRLGVAMNRNSVFPLIDANYKAYKKMFDDIVANLKKNIGTTVKKAKAAAQKISQDMTVATFNNEISVARDVTQNIGNVRTFIGWGYDVGLDVGQANALFGVMTGWANKSPYLDKEATPEEIRTEFVAFVGALKKCEALAA